MPLLLKIGSAIGMYYLKKHALELALDAIIEGAEKAAKSTDFTTVDDDAVAKFKADKKAILKIARDLL